MVCRHAGREGASDPMRMITVGLNPEHAVLWKTLVWPRSRTPSAWRAEERRIAALPLAEILAIDPADLHLYWSLSGIKPSKACRPRYHN